MLVEYLECLHQLFEVGHGPGLWKMPFHFQQLLQCTTIAELVHKVEVVVGLEHLDALDNVWGRFDAGEGVDFIDSTLF